MDAKEQFNNQAKFYSSSKTFSAGESLNILSNILKNRKFESGFLWKDIFSRLIFEGRTYCIRFASPADPASRTPDLGDGALLEVSWVLGPLGHLLF